MFTWIWIVDWRVWSKTYKHSPWNAFLWTVEECLVIGRLEELGTSYQAIIQEKNIPFHLIQAEMIANMLLNTLMFIQTNFVMVMNHSVAQVFQKVRYKLWLSVRYRNKHLEEPKEHISVFLTWLHSRPYYCSWTYGWKLSASPIPLWNNEAQTILSIQNRSISTWSRLSRRNNVLRDWRGTNYMM